MSYSKEVVNLSKAAKALILTWLMIGFFVAGAIGFYLGRATAPSSNEKPAINQQNPGQPNQPLRGATPSATPNGPSQGGQQPVGGGQPPPPK